MHQNLARFSIDGQIQQNGFVDPVMVEEVMWTRLVKPCRIPIVRVPCENAARVFVITRPYLGVPRAGITGAVITQVQFRIVSHPAPDGTAADLPLVWGPTGHAKIFAAL